MSQFKRDEMQKMMKDLGINIETFTEDELKMFENGSLGQSFLSLSDHHQPINNNLKVSQTTQQSNIEELGLTTNMQTQHQNRQIPINTQAPLNPQTQSHQNIAQNQNQINHKFQVLVQKLEKQNDAKQQDINRIVATNESEKQMILNESRREIDRLQNEIRSMKQKTQASDSQVPLIKESLSQVRDMLNNLVPETTYLKLRDIPISNLTPSEWVLVNSWEMIYPFKKENELMKQEVARLREEFKKQQDKQHQLLSELEHSTKLLNDKDEDYKRYSINFENSRKNMEIELQRAHEELGKLREEGAMYDEVKRRFKLVEQEKFLLEEKIGFHDAQNNKEGASLLNDHYRQLDDQRRKNDILQRDKEYLTKENIQLLEKNKRVEDRCDRLERDLLDAKDEVQKYLFQFLNFKNDSNLDFEKRINNELQTLRQSHQQELQQQRKNIIDIYETQKKFAEDSLADMEDKYNHLEQEYKNDKKSYQTALVENKTHQQQYNNLAQEMNFKIELEREYKNRTEQQAHGYKDDLNKYKIDNEALHQKLDLAKNQIYQLKEKNNNDNQQIRAELQVARTNLENYSNIERELDQAIEQGDSNHMILNAPTAQKRRIQQSLQLSQQLSQCQRDLEASNKRCQKLQSDLQLQQGEMKRLKEILAKNTDRQIRDQLHNIEMELQDQQTENQQLQKQYNYLETEHRGLQQDYQGAAQQIDSLKMKREHIIKVRQQLIDLCSNNQQPGQSQKITNIMNEVQDVLDTQSERPINPAKSQNAQKKWIDMLKKK